MAELSSQFEQSLPICCSLAVIGGILEVAATAVTAVPSAREAQGKKAMAPWLHYMSLAGNVSLQLTGSLMSHLVATWFGPVSIVVPFFYAATLLTNMILFGLILGLEFFNKIMRVGTYVIVVAVVLLPVVGPSIQENQNINELLHHWPAIIWFGLLLAAMSVTGLMVSLVDIMRFSMNKRIAILLIARASSIAINLTVSRSFILGPTHLLFVSFLVLKMVSGAIYTYAIVVQSNAVDQARFVPLNTTIIIITNAITGIIIWQDWKVMVSWYGYLCVFALLGLGCDLLLSESTVPLLNEENPSFGIHKRASMILSVRSITLRHQQRETTGLYQQIPDISDNHDGEDEEDEDVKPISHKESTTTAPPTAAVTLRQAWASVTRNAAVRIPTLSVSESTGAAALFSTSKAAIMVKTSHHVMTTSLTQPMHQMGSKLAHAATGFAKRGKEVLSLHPHSKSSSSSSS